ncbi:unnamed protein product [Effrenium voratum]|uniref:Protein kinase domain-containing protein n=1 Tax=Effrenium voratum TaxID=2562239 RepID=A0AA36HQL4_9DINO|nr:unnamed protein product [Effrenium voratum]
MAGARAEDQKQQGNVVLYVVVAIYLVLLLVVAKIAHSRKRRATASAGEVQAHFGGSFGAATLLLTTFSTVYSGFTVTGIPDEAFDKGFVSLRWVGATLVIVAAMLLLYPRLRRLAVTREYKSPIDFVSDRYGTIRLRLLCAACGVVPMIIYITAQMLSFAAMVQGMTFQVIPKWACILVFIVLMLTLEVLGGMNSVVLTDVVQSTVMILSFLAVPFFLAFEYGSLPDMGPADCPFLMSVSPNVTDSFSVPEQCMGSGCVAAGCIAAVKPEFYEFPSRSTLCDVIFFLINMLAAPLQPHMVQRAYIASSDASLRLVMAAMLLAPFVAQPPGIIIGLTKSAYDPAWPLVDRGASAFSAVTAQLKMAGPIQYFLVSVMTCSTLAAIMSTADSALMGASSVVSMDVIKGTLLKSLSTKNVVRAGELTSGIVCAVSFALAMLLSSDQMGTIIVFQNGMLMQMLPAFGFGLYLNIAERAVTGGIAAGLVSLLILSIAGNPLDDYVPSINVSVFFNFLFVALVQVSVPGTTKGQLTVEGIRKIMSSSREPSIALAALMIGLALISAPWYGRPGEQEPIIFGSPRWGIIQMAFFVVIFGIGVVACVQWRPPTDSLSDVDVHGVAEGPKEAECRHTGCSGQVKMNREVQILQGLSHPRIVNLHAVHRTKQWVFLVMELVKGGELFDVIVSNKTLNEIEAKYIFRQLLEGVGYMHTKHVIHRDLKPENILIASSREVPPPMTGVLREVKIADFGLSKIINEGTSFAKTFVGTPQYWAPEVLNVQRGGGSYTQAADFWSLGAVLFVMLGGRYPFDGKAMPLEEQIRTATFSMTSAAWQRVSDEAKDMVRGLLKVNPKERLNIEDCMVHPWLAGAIPRSPTQVLPASKVTVTEALCHEAIETVPRRHLWIWALGAQEAWAEVPAAPASGPTFRTLRAVPEIPVATAVILLRTTQEAALDWGGPFSKASVWQTNFNKRRSEGFPSFRERYANYDLTGLLNQTQLMLKDPRTNRLYFSFLDEVQFRTLQDGIKRRAEQDRFGFNVGARLYRKILNGDEVGPRIQTQPDTFDPKAPVDMSSPFSGRWPALKPPLPKGQSAGDLAEGSRRLLEYLRSQGYCKDFSLSSFELQKDGRVQFSSFVLEPANLEATSTLMRSRGFPPRYDSRILQAFFADRGFDSELEDELSDGLDSNKGSRGVRTKWLLSADPDISLDGIEVPVVLSDERPEDDQDLIFCLNELLKLQVSIASSLEVACLAFRHADRDLSDNIRRAFNEANKLSAKAATVVSNYAQVAQQVSRNILPDLKLAIQEKEPSLAVSLLGIVKDWVSNMKKDGEQIQHLYSSLQQNVHDLILGAQRAKSGADRRLAESLQEQAEVGSEMGPMQFSWLMYGPGVKGIGRFLVSLVFCSCPIIREPLLEEV